MTNRPTALRPPVPAVAGALATGAVLAVGLPVGPLAGSTEPVITGSVLIALGVGWGLLALLSWRASVQAGPWATVPAVVFGSTGVALVTLQPGPAAMDLVSWIWPPALAVLGVWVLAQVRRHLGGAGRWLVVPWAAMLLAFALGGGITAAGAIARSDNPAPSGRLIDVGGRSLYLDCAGSGSPAVILQSGLSETSAAWARIAPQVAASTMVCAYDRAGHGRSDAAGPQDGIALATDLRTLLERAGVAGPYVLVGHSSGGPYVRVFADRFPDLVAGMILIDAQPADAFDALPDYPSFYGRLRMFASLTPSLARIGLLGPILGMPADQSTPAAALGARDEIVALPAALEQALRLTSLGGRPLIVVTAGAGQQAGWLEAQDRLPGLSTNNVHRVLADATHASLVTGTDAWATRDAILDIVAAIRSGTPVQ